MHAASYGKLEVVKWLCKSGVRMMCVLDVLDVSVMILSYVMHYFVSLYASLCNCRLQALL